MPVINQYKQNRVSQLTVFIAIASKVIGIWEEIVFQENEVFCVCSLFNFFQKSTLHRVIKTVFGIDNTKRDVYSYSYSEPTCRESFENKQLTPEIYVYVLNLKVILILREQFVYNLLCMVGY